MFWTGFTYDRLRRLNEENAPIAEGQPAGQITGYAFEGRDLRITDAAGNVTGSTYHLRGFVTGTSDPDAEGAKFWRKVFNELRTRGVHDILTAVVDGLKGLAEAFEMAFPKTIAQTCIVHLIRGSLDYAGWKDRKAALAAFAAGP